MAKCKFTGKRPLSGHRVSHSNRKTNHWQKPNVHSKRVWDEEQDKWVRIKVSARGLRTILKNGLGPVARKAGVEL